MRARLREREREPRRSPLPDLGIRPNRQSGAAERVRGRIEEEQWISLEAAADVDLSGQKLLLRRGKHRDRNRPIWVFAQSLGRVGVVLAHAAAEDDHRQVPFPQPIEGVREIEVVFDGCELVPGRALDRPPNFARSSAFGT